MYISRVELKNIRGVGPRGLTLDLATPAFAERKSLKGWTVIAGPNGSGKTTLLQAMVASLLGGAGSNWLFRPEDRRDWIHRKGTSESLTDRGTTCTWIEGVPEDDHAPRRETRVDPVPLCVEWPRDPSSVREIPPEGEHSAVLSQFWHAATFGARPDGWMFAGYGPHRGNRRSSTDAQSLFKASPRTASVVTLFRQDAGLEAASGWLIDLELRAARKKRSDAEALRDGVLRLLGNGLLVAGQQTQMRVESDGLHVHWRGAWRPARLLGDGHYTTLAVILDMLYRIEQFKPGRLLEDILRWPPEPKASIGIEFSGVVVIDEPESHLHPALQQRLGFWLKRHFENIQFIVTTHSPLICQAAEPGGLFTMPRCGKIDPLDRETWAEVTNGTLDTAIMSRLFGLESPQSDQAVKDRRRLGELEAKKIREALSADEESERGRLEARLPRDPEYQLDTLVQAFLKR